MSGHRHACVPRGTFFFTVVTQRRAALFSQVGRGANLDFIHYDPLKHGLAKSARE